MKDSANVIEEIINELLNGNKSGAKNLIIEKCPFVYFVYQDRFKRSYNNQQMMQVFIRDGFIDRYSGEKLVNPGILKVLSSYYPVVFPYQSHWKMTECHNAYWELTPTVDHINPIARGGADEISNWVSTSMLNNSIKSNWTLEQMRWRLYEPGSIEEWDRLTKQFIKLVEVDTELLSDSYIRKWYKLSTANYIF